MNSNAEQHENAEGFGLLILLVILGALYYFGAFDEDPIPKEQQEVLNAIQVRIQKSEKVLDYLSFLRNDVSSACTDFTNKLHEKKHFEIYQSTSIGTHSMTHIQKNWSPNLKTVRRCSVSGVNFDANSKANGLIMHCETGGDGYTSKGMFLGCMLNEKTLPKKIRFLNGNTTHALSGLGKVGGKDIKSIGGVGDLIGGMISGKVNVKIASDKFVDYVKQDEFFQEMTNLASMSDLVKTTQEKIEDEQRNYEFWKEHYIKTN